MVRIGIDKSEVEAGAVAAVGPTPGPAGRHRRQGVRDEGRRRPGPRPSSRPSSSGPTTASRPPNRAGVRDPRRAARSRTTRCWRPPATSPGRSSGRSARRPRRSSTSPDGTVVAGDQVGMSGLQQRYDEQLRGTPGVQVRLVAAKATGRSASPSPSAIPVHRARAVEPVTVFEAKPVAGKPLDDHPEHRPAEAGRADAGQDQAGRAPWSRSGRRPGRWSPRPTTPGTKGQSLATVGQAAARLHVQGGQCRWPCSGPAWTPLVGDAARARSPSTARQFENYSDYPSGQHGHHHPADRAGPVLQHRVHRPAGPDRRARPWPRPPARSGLGIDYDTGFSLLLRLGARRPDGHRPGRRPDRPGQGRGLTAGDGRRWSPRCSAGQTVLPHLVEGATRPRPKGKPLTAAEAAQLRQMMRAVVTEGSGRVLSELDGPR